MQLFRRKRQENATSQEIFKMITDVGNGFYAWNGRLYHSDIVRACVKPKTKAIGKMVAKHISETEKNGERRVEINPRPYIRFLLEEPNQFMTGQMLQEKVANQLALNGNAFILIIRDVFGLPCGLYPIPAAGVEARYNAAGDLMLKFSYPNGKWSEFPYSDIIHLRDDYVDNDLFGESPAPALMQLMQVVTTTDQGIVNAIKNSAVIRWLLKFTSAMRPEDLKLKAEEFTQNFLEISSNSLGVAAVDAKAEAIQIKNNDYVPNALQAEKQVKRIYSFFNTNDKIVNSNYTEDEWISYYEQCIEPIGVQMSNEYTRKLFSRRERGCGNRIIFESSSLTFASMSTKLQLVQFADRAIMTRNEIRGYLNLAPAPGGDEFILRKDTGTVGGGEE